MEAWAAVDDDDIAVVAVVVPATGTENDAAGVITMLRQNRMTNNTGCIHDTNNVNLMVVVQVESMGKKCEGAFDSDATGTARICCFHRHYDVDGSR